MTSGEEEVASLCTEPLVWQKGPKWLGTVLSCLAAMMPNTASCRSRLLCTGMWDWKRLMSCSYGREDLDSLILKVPVAFLPCLSPSFFL